MKTHVITFSKTNMIIKCCVITVAIACAICAASKVDAHQFIQNILDWDSI